LWYAQLAPRLSLFIPQGDHGDRSRVSKQISLYEKTIEGVRVSSKHLEKEKATHFKMQ
jgi:hypothetical protein